MATHRFTLKKGSLLPALRLSLLQGDGTKPGGTLSAIKFRMQSRRTGLIKVNDANGVIVDATNKIVEYQWIAADVDTVGLYDAEFEATIDGKKSIFPAFEHGTDGALEVDVTPVLT